LDPDPWDPSRLALVKEATKTNYWYAFLYDIFLNGELSCWGDGSSNVLLFLVKPDLLELMKVSIDLVPLMNYKFLLAWVPCLWKTHLEKDRLQVLVDAIERNPHLVPKAQRFCICSFRPDAKIHFASSRKTCLTWKMEKSGCSSTNSVQLTHFFWHPSFCLDYAQNVWKSKFRSLFLLVLEGPVAVQKLVYCCFR
jgi:hypothetical protein